MTTPTKEQFLHIFLNTCKRVEEGIKDKSKADFNEPIFLMLIIQTAIDEWEKIRNSPK